MMRRSLITSVLAVAALAVPAAPASADGDLAIRSITVRPADPVVGPSKPVKLVIDVVARGAGEVDVVLQPGRPERTAKSPKPRRPPGEETAEEAVQGPAGEPVGEPSGGDGTEWEIWRFLPQKALSRWYPSGLWTITVTAKNEEDRVVTARTAFSLRRATRLEGVKVVRNGDGVRITGTLLRVDPKGRVDYRPFGKQRVIFSFRPAGADDWQVMGDAVTRKDGWFSARLNDAGDGQWRAEYGGNNHYAGDASSGVAV